jgi:hypothetical protein
LILRNCGGIGAPPWGIEFLHNLPNKPLSDLVDLQIAENKQVDLQNQQNTGVMVSLELGKITILWRVDSVASYQEVYRAGRGRIGDSCHS